MKRYILFRFLISMCVIVLMAACSSTDNDELAQPRLGVLQLTASVSDFEGMPLTRTNIAGNAFAVGDRMKLKIICPFSDHTEFGETTYGHSADALWLMKWNGTAWTPIVASDQVDVEGQYAYTDAPNLFSQYEAQQTPYVYTASTWSENILFISNGSMYSQYSYVFHADQTEENDYLSSDLLWAQSYMQTGSYNVHLSFQHVMACLKIAIPESFSASAVVTLEGMPAIDQREVVVGDYYAGKSKVNSGFGYQQKCSCAKEYNGQVLGVAVNDDAQRKAIVYPMTGNPNPNSLPAIPNDGVYTAYRDAASCCYYLIVPPCKLSEKARFWIRDGERRYSYELQTVEFKQGEQYPVTITLATE